MVLLRFGRKVEDPPDSSDSDSSESESSSEVLSVRSASAVELRVDGDVTPELGGPGRLLATGEGDEVSKREESSVLDGGRNAGEGELARWRAAISRNAATEIRCEVSEATLLPLGLGRTGGVLNGLESAEGGRGTSTTGESDPTCRNDLRLKESAERSTLSSGGGGGGRDLLRPLAHARNPPFFSFLPFRSLSEFGGSLLL